MSECCVSLVNNDSILIKEPESGNADTDVLPNTKPFNSLDFMIMSENSINILYTNTDVLHNKIDEIELITSKNDIDIIAITETLPKKMPDYTKPEDFTFILKGFNAVHNNNGRGVCIFIKDGLDYEHVLDYDDIFKTHVTIKIKNGDESITLCLIYRSPNSLAIDNDNLLKLINEISSSHNVSNKKLIFIGDFNLPGINWSHECTNHLDPDKHFDSKFLNCIHEQFLSQLVNNPTHYRGCQTPTLIDLLITNDSRIVENLSFYAPIGNSHHVTLGFSVQSKSSKPKPKQPNASTKYLYEKGDYVGMRAYINSVDWCKVFTEDGNVDSWQLGFESILNEAQIKFIPKKIVRTSLKSRPKRSFHAPDTLLTKLHDKRKAFRYYKDFPTISNRDNYIYHRNLVNSEVKKAKREKELMIAKKAKSDPKLLFKYISSKTKPKENIANLLNEQGILTTSDAEKCKVLNDFFSSVFVDEGDSPVPEFTSDFEFELNNITITDEDMYNALNKLNTSKAPGPDSVHPKILKELAREFAHPLRILFDKTLKDGKLPDPWKEAQVSPIFKKGKKNAPGNYRPVSLTSIICKVFETFIRDALCNHLSSNKLLSKDQFGFSKGRSCISQLLVTIDEWLTYMDKKIPVDVAYLDFRKAFDSVPHKRLISKLQGYGVRGNVLQWIKDFLTNRYQHVKINDSSSNKVPVTSGVPQGSVLGPSLFIYFINDLPNCAKSLIKIFADDTKNYSPITSIEDRDQLQSSINQLVKWSELWLVRFNSDKCKIMHLGKNNPHYDYTIKEGDKISSLVETCCEKDLGVNIDPELTFKSHINLTIKKARKVSGMIIRNINYKDKDIMVPIYKALIRPILEYGNVVWCPHLLKDIKAIEKVQQHFTKTIKGYYNMSYPDRLKKLDLPSLEYRRLRGDLIEVFKVLHNKYDPLTTDTLFQLNTYSKTRSNGFKLYKPGVNSTKYRHFFTNRVIDLWNGLPESIVTAGSLNLFKNGIDRHFREHIYSTAIHIA